MNNSEVTKRILETLKLSVSDGVPQQVSNVISPVIIANPQPLIKTARAEDSATGSTILTTSATRKTKIIGAMLSIQKDVNSTVTAYYLQAIIGGAAMRLGQMNFLTTTIAQDSQYLSFSQPIEVDRNSVISSNLFGGGVGNHFAATTIFYYEEELL